jgi:hypothetical protein
MAAESWGRAISGPVLGVAGLGLLAAQQTITDPKAASVLRLCGWGVLVIAGLMIFVAQYEVWKQEYEARAKAQAELDANAEVRGQVRIYCQGGTPAETNIGFRVEVANYGRQPCEIVTIKATIVLAERTFTRVTNLHRPSIKELTHGRSFIESSGMVIPLSLDDVLKCNVSFSLVDALGNEHSGIKTIYQFASEEAAQ